MKNKILLSILSIVSIKASEIDYSRALVKTDSINNEIVWKASNFFLNQQLGNFFIPLRASKTLRDFMMAYHDLLTDPSTKEKAEKILIQMMNYYNSSKNSDNTLVNNQDLSKAIVVYGGYDDNGLSKQRMNSFLRSYDLFSCCYQLLQDYTDNSMINKRLKNDDQEYRIVEYVNKKSTMPYVNLETYEQQEGKQSKKLSIQNTLPSDQTNTIKTVASNSAINVQKNSTFFWPIHGTQLFAIETRPSVAVVAKVPSNKKLAEANFSDNFSITNPWGLIKLKNTDSL